MSLNVRAVLLCNHVNQIRQLLLLLVILHIVTFSVVVILVFFFLLNRIFGCVCQKSGGNYGVSSQGIVRICLLQEISGVYLNAFSQ